MNNPLSVEKKVPSMPLGVVLHDVLQTLDLLLREVLSHLRCISLECVTIILAARSRPCPPVPAGGSTAIILWQQEGVGAASVLDAANAPPAAAAARGALCACPPVLHRTAHLYQHCCQPQPKAGRHSPPSRRHTAKRVN
ncbi:hypothetical protein JZ751_009567 [Albula glossodonta]|uniref:Uncharacterized protein n=1 Tax=Albula glossodonta TaxID=121402 RepID=A0A8T2P8S2_9TELE|nr:hypothetical protein JZ751_009567 [Albula glossodonta]